jgi:hypothetical protein
MDLVCVEEWGEEHVLSRRDGAYVWLRAAEGRLLARCASGALHELALVRGRPALLRRLDPRALAPPDLRLFQEEEEEEEEEEQDKNKKNNEENTEEELVLEAGEEVLERRGGTALVRGRGGALALRRGARRLPLAGRRAWLLDEHTVAEQEQDQDEEQQHHHDDEVTGVRRRVVAARWSSGACSVLARAAAGPLALWRAEALLVRAPPPPPRRHHDDKNSNNTSNSNCSVLWSAPMLRSDGRCGSGYVDARARWWPVAEPLRASCFGAALTAAGTLLLGPKRLPGDFVALEVCVCFLFGKMWLFFFCVCFAQHD